MLTGPGPRCIPQANVLERRQCEVRRMHLPRTLVNKGKRAGTTALALLPRIVRLLLSSPYLAIHLLKERLAPLVALLVIAN